jgi:hypothetical protein
MKRTAIIVTVTFLLGLFLSAQVRAEEAPPVNTYWDDFWTRSTLTGDWGGVRVMTWQPRASPSI